MIVEFAVAADDLGNRVQVVHADIAKVLDFINIFDQYLQHVH